MFMLLGGRLGRRVAKTMAENITLMHAEQGFVASLVTAILVILASYAGLPVSTTHVSVGALFGIAMANRTAKLQTVAHHPRGLGDDASAGRVDRGWPLRGDQGHRSLGAPVPTSGDTVAWERLRDQ